MIFLHPQSRGLFRNLYEVENGLLPAISNTTKILQTLLRHSRDEDSEKNAVTYIAGMSVDSFLKAKKYEGNYYEEGVKKKVSLETNDGRELFVKNFPKYIETIIIKYNDLNIGENSFLNNLGSARTFLSTFPIVTVPKYHLAATDEAEKAIMQGGLNQLKVSKGNDTIDEFLLEVYHNLSVYALISNSGQGTKGSMFPMFDVINDDFAEYINTLTFEDIKKMLPKSKDVVKLLLGKPNTLESIMRKKTFVSNTEFIHGSSYS